METKRDMLLVSDILLKISVYDCIKLKTLWLMFLYLRSCFQDTFLMIYNFREIEQ